MSDDDYEPDFEMDGFIQPHGLLGAMTAASFDGKHIGIFRTERRALAAIRLEMMRSSFWPNVWSISDHGNVHGPISVHGGR